MFPVNQVIVAARIDELHAAASAERLARTARPASHGQSRIASALTSFWSILGGPDRAEPLPKLTDYPFRG
jgi:hypothetical protein